MKQICYIVVIKASGSTRIKAVKEVYRELFIEQTVAIVIVAKLSPLPTSRCL